MDKGFQLGMHNLTLVRIATLTMSTLYTACIQSTRSEGTLSEAGKVAAYLVKLHESRSNMVLLMDTNLNMGKETNISEIWCKTSDIKMYTEMLQFHGPSILRHYVTADIKRLPVYVDAHASDPGSDHQRSGTLQCDC